MSRRILAIGTTRTLRLRYSNVYYIQILLKTAPLSTVEEMTSVRSWVQERIDGAMIEREVLGGQIRFTFQGSRTLRKDKTEDNQNKGGVSTIVDLIHLLEAAKEDYGIEYYSIGGATLERVFLNVMKENSINEDEENKAKTRWWKF
ncbi:hypothetical protein LY76DRAFT_511201 [Colletotrichum caudatum]|nr:hypothetical protein LY76DRAFT_511201 [Colletotrichum caudatum]